ncbi:hypothetical protein FB567DRAFT_539324 [Paraphoma chrysanthemicola]|uniref:L-lysine 2,3-aminomutase n=1 Tax=Paraphoma chrysanthemicola TaxID=798071 RepID=A0A8K0VS50_9PLEO|nr:hypothetical protein FB567DRAFT_539324 [Paraphoma chrysanthemicola]
MSAYDVQRQGTIFNTVGLLHMLGQMLPDDIKPSLRNPLRKNINTKSELLADIAAALDRMPMAIQMTPHLVSLIDWTNPLNCPIFRQFVPLHSELLNEHPESRRDSLCEKSDEVLHGLVHRYKNKALFLATSACAIYCPFCTRAAMVGSGAIEKEPTRPDVERWNKIFEHLASNDAIHDVVLSGGDVYTLPASRFEHLLSRLLESPHIKRVRIGSRGLCAAPSRILDPTDRWTATLLKYTASARQMGKELCLHTHFNHAREMNDTTREAARFLYQAGVTVRNQAVVLRGINDTVEDQSDLIHALADIHIPPYYVYQCDMTPGIEHLRTPLSTIIKLEKAVQGITSGFYIPKYVVDLPGGGGKRPVSTYTTYDESTGVSTWQAPGLGGEKGEITYTYHDPLPPSLSEELDMFPMFRKRKPIKR